MGIVDLCRVFFVAIGGSVRGGGCALVLVLVRCWVVGFSPWPHLRFPPTSRPELEFLLYMFHFHSILCFVVYHVHSIDTDCSHFYIYISEFLHAPHSSAYFTSTTPHLKCFSHTHDHLLYLYTNIYTSRLVYSVSPITSSDHLDSHRLEQMTTHHLRVDLSSHIQ